MNPYFKDKVCEVCSKPATLAIQDIKETPPEHGFRCWEPNGIHHFCEKHKRSFKKQYLERG